MKTRVFAAALAAFIFALSGLVAEARPQHRTHHSVFRSGGCPAYLGCGCNLASYFHIAGRKWRELWVARAWKNEGSPSARGCVECVAVLRRGRGGHVGIVRGYDANGNPIIYSYGNRRTGWHTATYPANRVIAYRQL